MTLLKLIVIIYQAFNLYETNDDVIQINGKEELDKFIKD